MRKRYENILFLFFICLIYNQLIFSQVLTQSNFLSINNLSPQYMASGSSSRLPYMFRAEITGLNSNTTYRYYIKAAISSDFGNKTSGAGNSLLVNSTGTSYSYFTSPDLSADYEEFTTDALGSYTGWFGFVHTGNARFASGNTIYSTITLNDGAGGTSVTARYALDQGINVLSFGSTSTDGTGIRGDSFASDKNIVVLYDNTTGSGRPLAITPLQNIGLTIASLVSFYANNVEGVSGAWGVIIPNNLPNGVRRIEQFSIVSGNSVNFNTDADGVWGTTNTVNPTSGTSSLYISSADAPLPVELTSFSASIADDAVKLNWRTETEVNNYGFDVERKTPLNPPEGGRNSGWEMIGFVEGHGNSNSPKRYSFIDNDISSGRYAYRLKQIDNDGSFEYSKIVEIDLGLPLQYELSQNYPNPFNPSTTIKYQIPGAGNVKLTVFNILGEVVNVLVDRYEETGVYSINFNASTLKSGVYFYKLESADFIRVKKMSLIK